MIYIYTLTNDKNTEDIRYIGKTSNLKNRLKRHLSNYSLNSDTYKNRWIKKELLLGNKILIHSIEEVNENNWQEREIYWIKKYKELGFNLTNTTLGGEGLILENEILEKRSSTRIKNNLESKKEEIELFKIKEIDDKWTGERICPKCERVVIHNSKEFNELIYAIKKSLKNKCSSCKKIYNKDKIIYSEDQIKSINDKIVNDKYSKYNLKFEENTFSSNRICPKCDNTITHSSKSLNGIINLLKKSINRNCASCSSKEKTPFTNHTWSNKGKKYPNTINPAIIKEKYGKKLYQYDLDNNLIDEFVSIRDAANKTKIDRKSISHCLKGIRKTAGGYIFKEKDTE